MVKQPGSWQERYLNKEGKVMRQNMDLMKDTINDVAQNLEFEVTDAEKNEILEEIFSTDEWSAVMNRILDMMYKNHEIKYIIEKLKERGYTAKAHTWYDDLIREELEITKGSNHITIKMSDAREMDIEGLLKLAESEMKRLNNK